MVKWQLVGIAYKLHCCVKKHVVFRNCAVYMLSVWSHNFIVQYLRIILDAAGSSHCIFFFCSNLLLNARLLGVRRPFLLFFFFLLNGNLIITCSNKFIEFNALRVQFLGVLPVFLALSLLIDTPQNFCLSGQSNTCAVIVSIVVHTLLVSPAQVFFYMNARPSQA